MQCKRCGSTSFRRGETRASKSGISKTRYRCKVCNSSLSIENVQKETSDSTSKKYVITSCQNDVSINEEFLSSLQTYCEKNDAKLKVFAIQHLTQSNIITPPVWEYDDVLSVNFEASTFKVLNSFKTSISNASPLAGVDELSRGKHIIVPHSQLAMKTLATLNPKRPIFAYSTGTITNPAYSNTKAGFKAEFNHSFSALYVEIVNDDITHIRVLNADNDGGFYDLDRYYLGDSITELDRIEALITGDEHAIFSDQDVLEATYTSKNSLVNRLRPKTIVRHDVLDFYSGSHHHENNFFTRYRKNILDLDNVEDELYDTAEYLVMTTPEDSMSLIVCSNHNDHLTKWLNLADPKVDIKNAKIYHWLMYNMIINMENGIHTSPFETYVRYHYDFENRIEFTNRNESYKIMGIEVSQHGDKGQNGSRGAATQFARMSSKHIIGHTHSPKIEKGCYQVGTSTSRLEYAEGYSTWANTHCIVYPNGTRQLITIIDGSYC